MKIHFLIFCLQLNKLLGLIRFLEIVEIDLQFEHIMGVTDL